MGKVALPPRSRGSSADKISYKSKLKEHYDKKGQPGRPLVYKTEPLCGSGPFISYIFIAELGRDVVGSKAKNKKDAEQGAAQEVLRVLHLNNL